MVMIMTRIESSILLFGIVDVEFSSKRVATAVTATTKDKIKSHTNLWISNTMKRYIRLETSAYACATHKHTRFISQNISHFFFVFFFFFFGVLCCCCNRCCCCCMFLLVIGIVNNPKLDELLNVSQRIGLRICSHNVNGCMCACFMVCVYVYAEWVPILTECGSTRL